MSQVPVGQAQLDDDLAQPGRAVPDLSGLIAELVTAADLDKEQRKELADDLADLINDETPCRA